MAPTPDEDQPAVYMSDPTTPSPLFPSTHEQHVQMERRLSSFSAQEALGGYVFPSAEEREIREVDDEGEDMDTTADGDGKPLTPELGERFSKEEENVVPYFPSSTSISTHPSPPDPSTCTYRSRLRLCRRKANRCLLSPANPQRLLSESASYRFSGNRLFSSNLFLPALDAYRLALGSCPVYLVHEIATIHANIAAVELKLQRYPAAVKAANRALEGRPGWGKALYRRARGREGIGGWANMEAALEDYRAVERLGAVRDGEGVGNKEMEIVAEKVRWLPGRIDEVKNSETAEVVGKLRQMGEGLLRPFGINSEDFGMVKGADGGYTVQFRKS